MATQRLIVATIVGKSAMATERLFHSWRTRTSDPAAIDQFCGAVQAHAAAAPIVYFCEWLDRWLMGDAFPAIGTADGHRFHAACLTPEQALDWAGRCGHQFPEQSWVAARLREAAESWAALSETRVIVQVREVLGGSVTDDEVRQSLAIVPDWLLAMNKA